MGTPQRFLLRLLLITALAIPALAPTGCGGAIAKVASFAARVLPVIAEAAAVLDAIDLQAKAYFKEHPDRELEKKYVQAAAKARLSLSVASRLSRGTQQLDGANVEAAFGEYEKAFQEVLAVLGPLGVVVARGDGTLQAGVGDGALVVPLPQALFYTDAE